MASSLAQAAQFDLSGLPHYVPTRHAMGTIRILGSPLAGMVRVWEQGFRRYQPGVRFVDRFPSSDAGIAGVVSGVADLGPQAREQTVVEQLMFYEAFGHAASSVTVATGGYDAEGMADGLVIFVNRDNPLSRLTLAQLDAIFGAERTGALRGFTWNLKSARGASGNIRSWGQLGLTGRWADEEIHTYGYAPTGMSRFFQLNVLQGSDKWNPGLREYVESGTKMIAGDDHAKAGGLHYMLARELSKDRYGIAFGVLSQARGVPGVKTVALARSPSEPFVLPTARSFQDRSYPLSRSIYIYFNRAAGQPLAPCAREFLRYVLSREGQEAVERKSKYLPLNAALARDQLRHLGAGGK
ncbi:MAG: PstS family phosphate ABC transporter substrate-binding protein [Steroidobacterales bacterium]